MFNGGKGGKKARGVEQYLEKSGEAAFVGIMKQRKDRLSRGLVE